jgi:hypothetical protein
MSEAMDLLTTAPENLHRVAVECFKREFPGEDKIPEKLDAAKREYECYILYFV